ncbi:MAG TPA: NUDIX hydrolase [Candidatus Moranbacteria bacterium]|nr:NUDIX hydrolase [Candidatus Moranbacteria bacterium]
MTKICDHTSVGILAWKEDKLLLIERKKFPFGFAVPAGHMDSDVSYEEAAIRELEEEVGLKSVDLELLIEGRKENPCRRENGDWHYWKIYRMETKGEIQRSLDETKQAAYLSIDEIRQLGQRTEKYLVGKISEEEWEDSPGIEPVWYEWFRELKII